MKPDTSAIIVCAGDSVRMGRVNKQFLPLGDSTVVGMSLTAFQNSPSVKEIIVVSRKFDIDEIKRIAELNNITKLKHVVTGGRCRQESVLNGYRLVAKDTKLITIHDGARPLVLIKDIEECIAKARTYGGATLGVPVKDTIKVVTENFIVDTPYRPCLYNTQTPQTFKKSIYAQGVDYALRNALVFNDDCQLVEVTGTKVYMVRGHYSNIKITTPEDIDVAETLLKGLDKDV